MSPIRVAVALGCAGLGAAGPVAGQGYRVRLDARVQQVAYRGVTPDSVPVTDTITGPTGGPITPDGFAVDCMPGAPYCRYWRPGPERHAAPFTVLADATVWGLGIPGLSLRGTGRVNGDLAGNDAWPGVEPRFELLEGYAEYAAERFTARAGRQLMTSRFGVFGYDGAAVTARWPRYGAEVGGYAGWGLARATALPVTSPVLNPLDEYRPGERTVTAGLTAGVRRQQFDVRAEYQREVDPTVKKLSSERAAVAAALRPMTGITVALASDWDLAFGAWGTAELTGTYADPRVTATLGARRYRPHFDLWTIWGAFSPVPYSAAFGSAAVNVTRGVALRGRGEVYRFAAAEAATPLVDVEDDGYRWELGATWMPRPGWALDGGYHADHGPGAAAGGLSLAATYAPEGGRVAVTVHGARLVRPLEFRYNEATVLAYGVDADVQLASRARVTASVAQYDEERQRPDAAAFDWDQLRLSARLVLSFGRGGELEDLPPAIRRMPGGRVTR